MFKQFAGGDDSSWPLSKIIAALKSQFGAPELLGEEGPLKVYGVQDSGLNFVVAVMESAPGSGKVLEIGFLARFVGFPTDVQTVNDINRKLHVSVATLEGADLFLMAGVQVSGRYDQRQFMMLLEAWRQDLVMTMHGISGEQASFAEISPVAGMASAVKFATNVAPGRQDASPIDMLSSFLGDKAVLQSVCPDCNGRGKRGLFARMCDACNGTGFIGAR